MQHLTWSAYDRLTLEAAAGLLELGIDVGDRVAILASNRAGAPRRRPCDPPVRRCPREPVRHDVGRAGAAHPVGLHALGDPAGGPRRPAAVHPAAVVRRRPADGRRLRRDRRDADMDPAHRERPRNAAGRARANSRPWRLESSLDDPLPSSTRPGRQARPRELSSRTGTSCGTSTASSPPAMTDYPFRAICYLPLAHIVERVWSIYLATKIGGRISVVLTRSHLVPTMQEFRPSWFMGVPRIWEKLASAAQLFLERAEGTEDGDRYARDQALALEAWRLRSKDAQFPRSCLKPLRRHAPARFVRFARSWASNTPTLRPARLRSRLRPSSSSHRSACGSCRATA